MVSFKACFREKTAPMVNVKSLVFQRETVERLNSEILKSSVNRCILKFHHIFEEAIIFTDMEGEEYPQARVRHIDIFS